LIYISLTNLRRQGCKRKSCFNNPILNFCVGQTPSFLVLYLKHIRNGGLLKDEIS